MKIYLLIFLATFAICHKLSDFGAIIDDPAYSSVLTNGQAFEKALLAANSSQNDKTVLIEANHTYHMLPSNIFYNLQNITIKIDGSIIAWEGDISLWPKDETNHSITLISIRDSQDLTFTGSGLIEGLGYRWWWHVILIGDDNRPCLLEVRDSANLIIENLTFSNSPEYNLNLRNIKNGLLQYLNITVDVFGQQKLLSEYGLMYKNFVPTFPLNTDGVDISGINITIRNSTIICFDDAVAVKPISGGSSNFTNCTQNILIDNCYVKYGVGMSIGSVPPHLNCNCVKNITISNIYFETPIKAIYIKSNPGTKGTGLIQHIYYENIKITNALMWAVYIGPQQQHQPHGGADTGCSFFYPLPFTECPTNPLVTFDDVALINVEIEGGVFSPGIILCNSTNPCTNFVFQNVTAKHWSVVPYWNGLHCENTQGKAIDSKLIPDCFN